MGEVVRLGLRKILVRISALQSQVAVQLSGVCSKETIVLIAFETMNHINRKKDLI